ncbi:protein of unknown function (plasmid) [Caballeronia sp. S22]
MTKVCRKHYNCRKFQATESAPATKKTNTWDTKSFAFAIPNGGDIDEEADVSRSGGGDVCGLWPCPIECNALRHSRHRN